MTAEIKPLPVAFDRKASQAAAALERDLRREEWRLGFVSGFTAGFVTAVLAFALLLPIALQAFARLLN